MHSVPGGNSLFENNTYIDHIAKLSSKNYDVIEINGLRQSYERDSHNNSVAAYAILDALYHFLRGSSLDQENKSNRDAAQPNLKIFEQMSKALHDNHQNEALRSCIDYTHAAIIKRIQELKTANDRLSQLFENNAGELKSTLDKAFHQGKKIR